MAAVVTCQDTEKMHIIMTFLLMIICYKQKKHAVECNNYHRVNVNSST